jgi:HD-GYP domain-containing protein (c-di-GMP phosphodiesterase class II)
MAQELKQSKILASEIQMGMYVSALDRPWEDSPFLLQGFVVSSPKVLAKLQSLCKYVYVDNAQSINMEEAARERAAAAPPPPKGNPNDPYKKSEKPLPINKDKYEARPRMSSTEMKLARESYQKVQTSLTSVFKGVSENSLVNPQDVSKASSTLVSSAVAYPSALSWLALIQRHNNKVYDHALRTSTWALLCGRHIGLDEQDLKWLAIGSMIKDMGQLQSRKEGKKITTADEAVQESIKLAEMSKMHKEVIQIIACHREKFNGTGKPRGLAGEDIPLLARITSIATAYDLALNPLNRGRDAMSSSEAARFIYSQRGRAFQDELAVQFIESLGTYPLGTILQLDTGEVAVVVDQDEKFRLKPKVMVITDEEGQPLEEKRVISLAAQQPDNTEGVNARILKDLSTASFNIDMREIQQEYQRLDSSASSSSTSSPGGIFKKFFGRKK